MFQQAIKSGGVMRVDMARLLQELKGSLSEIYGEKLAGIYLYGSYAHREGRPESDVDIVIVLKDFQDYWEEVKRTSRIISELSLKFGVSISPIRIKEEDWLQGESPFLNNVRRECVPL